MNNRRFAISLHILTLLARAKDELLSSAYIASSINTNPALVRKELGNLRKLGLVTSREGRHGGSSLAKSARHIVLSDIYRAVRQKTILGSFEDHPNPLCPVGKQINKHLETLYQEAEEALVFRLGNITLADFCKRFK